jgi:hypothetical protein
MNMHADENSDGVIVPEKRPNKEGLPSAEAVEGRTPPKRERRRDGRGPDTAPGYRVERTHRRAPSGATEQECTVHCAAASLSSGVCDLMNRRCCWASRSLTVVE